MRATKLTATAAAAVCAVIPAVMGQTSAGAASTQEETVSTFVVKDRSSQVRELEIIRGQAADNELEIIRSSKRLRSLTLRADNERELEIIRGMRGTNDELEITRVGRP
ncbi:MAG: hypothetical protein ACRDO7_05810 [Nocardioidaceae bacterium]